MEQNNNKGRPKIILAIIVIGILVGLVIYNYRPPMEKQFGVTNFYEPVEGDHLDPKRMYRDMNPGADWSEYYCNTTMSFATNPGMAGNYFWIKEGEFIKSEADLQQYYVDGEDSQLKPYSDGDMIIAPNTLTFLNKNVRTAGDLEEDISIMASIGASYVIIWSNVECWWCHIGKSNSHKHTAVVGAGGINEVCTEGYIIGQAKSDTIVSLYKRGADGLEPCSFKEYFLTQ